MKNFFLLLVSAFAVLHLSAQEYSVAGRISENSEAKTPLPLVKVDLLNLDSAVVATGVTADDGAFKLKAKQGGKYLLRAAAVGYERLIKSVQLKAEKPQVDMGTLLLKPSDIQLSEAQVTALSQQLTFKDDTLVFHSKAFQLPTGATLAALVKQLPGLEMDADGNLTFQGKTVSSILVDGKPFFGTVSTAMANMVADAIQDIKVYDKTNEDKEFTGSIDTEKQTVVDLKIKKEYKTSWNTNAEVGGGTHDRYLGKLFTTNFSDRRRTAIFAQLNNINQSERVDENGNWSYWGSSSGLHTYRTAGIIHSWDNGKKNTEDGNMRLNLNIDAKHNNDKYITQSHDENFLSANTSQHTYSLTDNYKRYRYLGATGRMTWNIDSVNRLLFYLNASLSDRKGNHNGSESTYSAAIDIEKPYLGLLSENIPSELQTIGVNSEENHEIYTGHERYIYANIDFIHRFKKEGRSIHLDASGSYNHRHDKNDYLTGYRFFQPGAPADFVDRDYENHPLERKSFDLGAHYEEPLSKHLRAGLGYDYNYIAYDDLFKYYNLDYYKEYATMERPVGSRPTEGDSLLMALEYTNAYNSYSTQNTHRLSASLNGTWKNLEASLHLREEYIDERLDYERDHQSLSPRRSYFSFRPYAYLKWKYGNNSNLRITYSGSQQKPELEATLPFADDNEMEVMLRNPNLKDSWNNSVYISSNHFGKKRGDSYGSYITFRNTHNARVTTQQIDPLTGKKTLSETNVNGNYSFYGSLNTTQPLDSARHWSLSLWAHCGYTQHKSFVGSQGNALGLSRKTTLSPGGTIRLSWRNKIWSVNLSGMYTGDYSAFADASAYNQHGHTFEATLSPQLSLNCGLRINASLIYYGRRGYSDDMLNHDQWLLNAGISQSFLKNKALTVQLEAVDILGQRTSESNFITGYSRNYSTTKTYMSYVMLRIGYRFSLGGKN